MLALYLSVLDDRSFEEEFTEVYNTYKRLVYHTAYKIMFTRQKKQKKATLSVAQLSSRGSSPYLIMSIQCTKP